MGLDYTPPTNSFRSALGNIGHIAIKDWKQEGRAREVITSTVFFAGLVLLILGFALGPNSARLQAAAPGILWTALAFASVLAAQRSFSSEIEAEALDNLLLYPIPHEQVYLGKLLANTGFLLLLAVIVCPLHVLIYNMPLGNIWWFSLTVGLGILGFAIISTFYAALTANLRAKEALLPVLMFPILIPVVLGTVKATGILANDGLDSELWSWIRLLALFDAMYLIVASFAFPFAVEA